MQRAGQIIEDIIKDLGLSERLNLSKIRGSWQEIFNPPMVNHMWPATLRDSVLFLNVDSPVWLQEISFYKKDILIRLMPYGVNDIRLRLGRVNSPKEAIR